MLTIVRNVRIEWSDCDPAGIIFYPRYFEIFDTSTTLLLERALGMKKLEYLKAYAFAGHPAVATRARFRSPIRFGDDVTIETKLTECAGSTFKLEHRVTKGAGLVAEGFETRAWIASAPDDPKRIASCPIPPEVLSRLESKGR
jgi:4-hydroxybenzoyl-CoA thioesterase